MKWNMLDLIRCPRCGTYGAASLECPCMTPVGLLTVAEADDIVVGVPERKPLDDADFNLWNDQGCGG